MLYHSHRGDGCPTPSTLAIRLVPQISLGRAVPLSHLPMLWENGELTRTNENSYAFPVTGGKQPLGGSTWNKAIAKKALKPAELALWPKSTEWGNHPLYDYGFSNFLTWRGWAVEPYGLI